MTRTTTRLFGAAAGLALVLPLSACGSGDDEKAATSIASQVREGGDADLQVSQKEADCIGEGFVDELGTDKLVEYDMLNEEMEATQREASKMSQEDADAAAAVFGDCADVKALMVEALESSGMPESASDCVNEELTQERIDEFTVALFRQDDSVGEELGRTIQGCVTGG